MAAIHGAAAGRSVGVTAHAGGGRQIHFVVVGRRLRPVAGVVAGHAVVRGRHVAAGLVAERRKGRVVAAHAGRRGLAVRERDLVTGEGLGLNVVALVAVEAGHSGGVQAAAAVVATGATAGHLGVVNYVRCPCAGGGMAGVAHRR